MLDAPHERTMNGSRREGRYSYAVDEGDVDCKSCTAGMIADCVALCCCPCGLLNFLALAFVKVPWVVGRRCLGRFQRRRKKWIETRRKCKRLRGEGDLVEIAATAEDGEEMEKKKKRIDGDLWDIFPGLGWEDLVDGNVSARVEAERMWLELYQVCHLGFGRVSYTGIQ